MDAAGLRLLTNKSLAASQVGVYNRGMNKFSLAQDIEFAQANTDEFGGRIAPMLRTVASLNQQASKVEFVAACVAAGFHPNTAAKQFAESRKLDSEMGEQYDTDGRNLNI